MIAPTLGHVKKSNYKEYFAWFEDVSSSETFSANIIIIRHCTGEKHMFLFSVQGSPNSVKKYNLCIFLALCIFLVLLTGSCCENFEDFPCAAFENTKFKKVVLLFPYLDLYE